MTDTVFHIARVAFALVIAFGLVGLLFLGCATLAEIASGDRRRELRYAQALARHAAEKYGLPKGWRPLGDMMGALSQIDNALTGLERAHPLRGAEFTSISIHEGAALTAKAVRDIGRLRDRNIKPAEWPPK